MSNIPTGMTNGLLMQYHTEVNNLQGSIIMFLLKGRLADFYKDYGVRINTILERKAKLQKEYFVFDGDKIKHEGEGKDAKPVMLDGHTYEQFMEKYMILMNEPVGTPLVLTNA